jgi:hypothetical protein
VPAEIDNQYLEPLPGGVSMASSRTDSDRVPEAVMVEVIPKGKETLKGLKGIMVLVGGDLGSEIEQLGLKIVQIQTDVECRLRKAGIEVVPRTEIHEEFGAPSLRVTLATEVNKQVVQVLFHVAISFEQVVKLLVGVDRYCFASTWETSSYGVVSPSKIAQLRDVIGKLVEMFVADYLEVNPAGQQKQRRQRQAKGGLTTREKR